MAAIVGAQTDISTARKRIYVGYVLIVPCESILEHRLHVWIIT
jgi:hypothetical protein